MNSSVGTYPTTAWSRSPQATSNALLIPSDDAKPTKREAGSRGRPRLTCRWGCGSSRYVQLSAQRLLGLMELLNRPPPTGIIGPCRQLSRSRPGAPRTLGHRGRGDHLFIRWRLGSGSSHGTLESNAGRRGSRVPRAAGPWQRNAHEAMPQAIPSGRVPRRHRLSVIGNGHWKLTKIHPTQATSGDQHQHRDVSSFLLKDLLNDATMSWNQQNSVMKQY